MSSQSSSPPSGPATVTVGGAAVDVDAHGYVDVGTADDGASHHVHRNGRGDDQPSPPPRLPEGGDAGSDAFKIDDGDVGSHSNDCGDGVDLEKPEGFNANAWNSLVKQMVVLKDPSTSTLNEGGDANSNASKSKANGDGDDSYSVPDLAPRADDDSESSSCAPEIVNDIHNIDVDGEDEMPDLARLVAATVRDKVVLDQMEEIRALKAQLAASQSVEITGPNGTPVYARGCFSNGDFNATSLQSLELDLEGADGSSANIDENGLFWDVGLTMVPQTDVDDESKSKTMPLNKLSNIEIRLGGIVYASSPEVEGTSVAFGIRPGNKFDLREGKVDMTRSAVIEFNTDENTGASAGGRAALLTFHIRDFPRGHWRSLQSVAMLNRSIALRQRDREEAREERRERQLERQERVERGEVDPDDDESDYESDHDEEDQDPLDVYNYLTLCLSKRHPGQRADITSVSLCVKSVRGRIMGIYNRGEEFAETRDRVFGKVDDLYREEQEANGAESLEDEFDAFD